MTKTLRGSTEQDDMAAAVEHIVGWEPDCEPPTRPTVSIVDWTPGRAAYYLMRMPKNRRTKPTKVAQYADDMRAGKWLMTGEPIQTDWLGNMLNGAHRSRAVVESGVTIQVVLAEGLDPSSQVAMDSGAPRSNADMLHLEGYLAAQTLAAAANVYSGWLTDYYVNAMVHKNPVLSHAGCLSLVQAHPNLASAAISAERIRRHIALTGGGIAVAYKLFTDIDPDACLDFFDRIVNYRTTGANGDPLRTLIRRAKADHGAGSRKYASTTLFMLCRTWNAYRDGKPLHRLQFGTPKTGWATIPEPR